MAGGERKKRGVNTMENRARRHVREGKKKNQKIKKFKPFKGHVQVMHPRGEGEGGGHSLRGKESLGILRHSGLDRWFGGGTKWESRLRRALGKR